MKYIKLIALLFIGFTSNAQNYSEWVIPTEKGDETYYLLTQEGYQNLLEPIDSGDLGGLATELLTIKSELVLLRSIVTDLQNKIKELQTYDFTKLSEKKEYEWILKNIKSSSDLYSAYNKTNTKKRGYSLVDICSFIEIQVDPTKENSNALDEKDVIVFRIMEKIGNRLIP